MSNSAHKHTNRLVQSTSPYLLQHAHNPVDWHPWSDEAWDKAKKENKLVLVSIGYSACHWCHVMERESFEDSSVADLMNRNFICIKVDREERPDVDQVYMNAVQIMTGSGGWPLNCFTLPDGRPIYGGTYFPKSQWMKVLDALHNHYATDPDKVLQYADELTTAVRQSELVPEFKEKSDFDKSILVNCIANWEKRFDNNEGGPNRVPKFPLPDNYLFLLRQAHLTDNHALMRHVELTLEKMAFGGIYDQAGGGFARYSTDGQWKVPHFEKMLYDNAQLVSLYAEAYRKTKNELYRQTIEQTLEFIDREMTSADGAFYSALDADSEGEEGKFYVWTREELKNILEDDYRLAEEYFNINQAGSWEDDNYILLRKKSDQKIATQFSISVSELRTRIEQIRSKILEARSKRVRPGLDNKILCSWNALMISGYAQAYLALSQEKYLSKAVRAAEHIYSEGRNADGGLAHVITKENTIPGFLEDYSFTSEAFMALYQCTADIKWLERAKELCDYAIKHFYDPASGMFFFTSDQDPALIARKMEVQDNVIPSSNASMATALFMLGKYYDRQDYSEIADKMLMQVLKGIPEYGAGYSKWAQILQWQVYPFYETAIVGKAVNTKIEELAKRYIPNTIFVPTSPPDPLSKGRGGELLPLLENKFVEGKTMIYVCEGKTCKVPTESVEEALKLYSNKE